MTVAEIASKLHIGDKKQIALISGYSKKYVSSVFSGDRSDEAKGAKEIIQTAKDLINSREDLKAKAQLRKSN